MFMVRFLVYINNKIFDDKIIFNDMIRLSEPCPPLIYIYIYIYICVCVCVIILHYFYII